MALNPPEFNSPARPSYLACADQQRLDALGIGVIGFDWTDAIRTVRLVPRAQA